MKLHILGICGTFMGGVAALAREAGHQVEGSDQNVYPPMSTQLEQLGIALREGYAVDRISDDCEQIVVGNALSRGNPAVEHVLNAGLDYISGPQWLAENVLRGQRVFGVAGTHGKTTTSSLLAFLLDAAGREPGFLIGGAPANFGVSARLGGGEDFVVEADEYDSAFFDKRSKFVHYRPDIAILNNQEFDHADIFADLDAIKTQFHHLVRTVPGNGRLIVNAEDANLADVLQRGAWTPVTTFGIDADADWRAELTADDGSAFRLLRGGEVVGEAGWPLLGRHNVMNALAAFAACDAAGVDVATLLPKLADFQSVARRLQHLGEHDGIHVIDDFAHHPTAIRTTIDGLRRQMASSDGEGRLIAVLEPRSNSMRLGAHAAALGPSLADADLVRFLLPANLPWDAEPVIAALRDGHLHRDSQTLIDDLLALVRPGDRVLFMSNGGFDGVPHRFLAALSGT
ncbi:MAG: UDP-N-acetylmuramate:L-alanyl-gamma-D-glutamyl-meso-diaminopimelate ligase [Xanthomonadales bacterium]|nr:UDP-N-acetylmuramate:L-alanyl-gamma-D-glutamyl-meso-diaminopimelate ligase [Xanthomonadales bacterium]